MPIWPQHYDPLGNVYLSALVAAIPALLLLGLVRGPQCSHSPGRGGGARRLLRSRRRPLPHAHRLRRHKHGLWRRLRSFPHRMAGAEYHLHLPADPCSAGSSMSCAAVSRRSRPTRAFSSSSSPLLSAPFWKACPASALRSPSPPPSSFNSDFVPSTPRAWRSWPIPAPVAFGSLGIPLTTLQQVTDLDIHALSATVAALLAAFSFTIPFLIVTMLAGWRGLLGIWPAALVAGLSYTLPQFLIATYQGPWLAAPVAGLSCILALVLLLRIWRPRHLCRFDAAGALVAAVEPGSARRIARNAPARL